MSGGGPGDPGSGDGVYDIEKAIYDRMTFDAPNPCATLIPPYVAFDEPPETDPSWSPRYLGQTLRAFQPRRL